MSRWTRRAGWIFALFLFWILFSQSLDYQSLFTGLVISAAVVFLNDDLLLSLGQDLHVTSKTLVSWTVFWMWMVVEIVKAGWQVAVLAFSPQLKIDPQFVPHTSSLREPMMRVTLANSITLTPGTLSVEAPQKGEFVVHVITREAADGLKDWHIEERLAAIERMR